MKSSNELKEGKLHHIVHHPKTNPNPLELAFTIIFYLQQCVYLNSGHGKNEV